MTEKKRAPRKEVVGQVISDKMDKTITVQTYRVVRHAKYKKFLRKTSIFKAHDETNSAKTGDTVRIYETRALSKTKRWNLAEIVEAAKEGAMS
jgi:small subunit ribosomal protein S17